MSPSKYPERDSRTKSWLHFHILKHLNVVHHLGAHLHSQMFLLHVLATVDSNNPAPAGTSKGEEVSLTLLCSLYL